MRVPLKSPSGKSHRVARSMEIATMVPGTVMLKGRGVKQKGEKNHIVTKRDSAPRNIRMG